MTVMMEEILIEPTEEWLPEAAAYKRAFEAAGDSMDGTGSLRTAQDMAQWLQTCRDFKRRETTPPQLVPPRSSYMCARRIMRCWACCRCGTS